MSSTISSALMRSASKLVFWLLALLFPSRKPKDKKSKSQAKRKFKRFLRKFIPVGTVGMDDVDEARALQEAQSLQQQKDFLSAQKAKTIQTIQPNPALIQNPHHVAAHHKLTGASKDIAANQPYSADPSLGMSDQQIRDLTPGKIHAITGTQINEFDAAQIASLGKNIAALNDGALTSLSPLQIEAIPPMAFHELSAAQLGLFDAQQVHAITAAQANTLTPDQVAGLGARLCDLNAEALSQLGPAQISAIDPADFAKLNANQLSQFTAQQCKAVTPDQAQALSPKQSQALNHHAHHHHTGGSPAGAAPSQFSQVLSNRSDGPQAQASSRSGADAGTSGGPTRERPGLERTYTPPGSGSSS